jgi:hypothetical protein
MAWLQRPLMIFPDIEMDDNLDELQPAFEPGGDANEQPSQESLQVIKLRDEFQSRLVIANLRTEAVRAGIIDMDGLKLIDLSAVRLDKDDRIVGGQKLMDDLKRNKPWLFGVMSSSSAAIAPASQPVRQKMALEMTNEEYVAARAAVTKYRF